MISALRIISSFVNFDFSVVLISEIFSLQPVLLSLLGAVLGGPSSIVFVVVKQNAKE